MLGFALLLFFNLLGLLLQRSLNIPFPPNVLGMVLLLLCLMTGLVKLHWIEPAAHFLLRHMMLFFVPFVIASVTLLPLLKANWLSLVVGVVVSTLLTLALTGYAAQWLIKDPGGNTK